MPVSFHQITPAKYFKLHLLIDIINTLIFVLEKLCNKLRNESKCTRCSQTRVCT